MLSLIKHVNFFQEKRKAAENFENKLNAWSRTIFFSRYNAFTISLVIIST